MKTGMLLLIISTVICQHALADNIKEEAVVLSCSGKESGIGLPSGKPYEKGFIEIVKIVKKSGNIVKVIVDDSTLTKTRRSVDSNSPTFLRWFEETSDGIITYGEETTRMEGAQWNIKLSSHGEFQRQGYAMRQKGTCVAQAKAF